MSEGIKPSSLEIRKKILEATQITGKNESELLDQVDRLFAEFERGHEIEIAHYQRTIKKLQRALEEVNKKPVEKHVFKTLIDEMNEEVYAFEKAHPELTRSLENIIRIFRNLGFT